jgi:hypothetical protein
MVGGTMTITLVCPICDKPLICVALSTYRVSCPNVGDHFYGAHGATEEEARAILEKSQKRLVDALSAKIALPIEQRKHNAARRASDTAASILAEAFREVVFADLDAGYPHLHGWAQQALDWLREWRKASGDTPINWWTSAYMKYGPPPWGDKP